MLDVNQGEHEYAQVNGIVRTEVNLKLGNHNNEAHESASCAF